MLCLLLLCLYFGDFFFLLEILFLLSRPGNILIWWCPSLIPLEGVKVSLDKFLLGNFGPLAPVLISLGLERKSSCQFFSSHSLAFLFHEFLLHLILY